MAKPKAFRFCVPARLFITVPDVTAEDAAEQLKEFLREHAADGVPIEALDDDTTRTAILFPDEDAVDTLSSDDLEEEETDDEGDDEEANDEEG